MKPRTTPASTAAPNAAIAGTTSRKYKDSSASMSEVSLNSTRDGRISNSRAAPARAQPRNSCTRNAASTAKVASCVTSRSP